MEMTFTIVTIVQSANEQFQNNLQQRLFMKKYLLTFFAVALLLTSVFIFGAYFQESHDARNHENRNKLLISSLANVVAQHEKGTIRAVNFAETFPFTWDKVFFFGPYTTPSRIKSVLGYPWSRAGFLKIRYDENITLIVFTKGGKVVEYLEYPRILGDFSSLKTHTRGIPINEAIFVMDENGTLTLLSKEE
jgi:hypothetical protein